MFRLNSSIAALALVASIPACAAAPISDQTQTLTSEIAPGFERHWQEGREDELKGLKNLAKANERIAKERARILEGERLIAEGAAGIEAQKIAYKSFAARVGVATTAKEARMEEDSLAAIAKSWGAAEDTLNTGNKTVKYAKKDLASAEKSKLKAEKLIARARADMASATVEPEPEVLPLSAVTPPLSDVEVVPGDDILDPGDR